MDPTCGLLTARSTALQQKAGQMEAPDHADTRNHPLFFKAATEVRQL